jgi:hypothetical protein
VIDLIKLSRSKSIISNIAYVALNILLAVGTMALVVVTNSWVPSCMLVFLSKWRIIAVRPRYWTLNIKSNLVDIIVGVSFAVMIYYVGIDASLALAQVILTVLYAIWLLFIKPKSSRVFMECQALCAIFLGFSTASILLSHLSSTALVAAGFVIGYGAARHILIASDDENEIELLSVAFGLIMAELSWVAHYWLVAYKVLGTGLAISQLAIVATLLGYALLSIYRSANRLKDKFRFSDVVLPVAFSSVLIIIVVLVFSEPIFSI